MTSNNGKRDFMTDTKVESLIDKLTETQAELAEANEMIAKLETALEAMICEAQTQLALYTQAYKREPYDTGILFQIHIKESVDRI